MGRFFSGLDRSRCSYFRKVIMRCLILCAGLGTRLRPMTDTIPKCMVNIAGKPCLQRIVDYLASFEVTEVIVNVHHHYQQIVEYFGNRLLYSYEPELLGEAETEKRLQPWLGDEYIVINGDTLTDLDFNRLKEVATQIGKCTIESWEKVYTGAKMVLKNAPIEKYHFGCYWQDIGTPEGLEKARKYYGERSLLPKV